MCEKNTRLLKAYDLEADSTDIELAGQLLREGKTVIIPTETVYGLAANALDETAVKQIFEAKGRPSDNPLIVHISELAEIDKLVAEFPKELDLLAESFWPGPLTIILPKSELIPLGTSGGLPTVAIRMPENEVARAIIKSAKVPLAAPSANRSGSPSPTTFEHCVADMDGRVDAIIESYPCKVGVESTVVTLCTTPPRLLRPGAVTLSQLRRVLPDLMLDRGVLNEIDNDTTVSSPGMKYKHYAPKAEIVMVKGTSDAFAKYFNSQIAKDKQCYAVCFEEDVPLVWGKYITYGKQNDHITQAREIFALLRNLDERNVNKAFIHAPDIDGVGLAVYNRLIRSAGFNVVEL